MRSTQNRRIRLPDRPFLGRRIALELAVAGVFVMLLAFGIPAQNQPAPVRKRAPSNRFLFVIDTSSAMKKNAEPILLGVKAILDGNAGGQMRTGDSLGIWTFNTDLYTGSFPLLTWDAGDPDSLALRVVEFLGRQPFEKKSHFDKALLRLNEVIQASDLITVFIISSGEGKMVGTPFDLTINRYYEQDLKEMGKSRMPLVTVLEARGGRVFDFTVNALPWPVIIHPLPIEPEPVEPPPVAVTPPPPTAPDPAPVNTVVEMPKGSPTVQSLILRGTPPKAAESNAVLSTVPLQPMTTTQLITNLPSTSAAVRPEAIGPPPAAPVAAARTDVIISNPPLIVKPAPIPASEPHPPVLAAKTPSPIITSTPPASAAPEVTLAKTNALPIQALAIPPAPTGRSNELLILGLAFLVIGVGLILLFVRRGRVTSGPSLITHSMGNPRKLR